MQIVAIWLYTGEIGGQHHDTGIFTIARTTFPALRATVMRDFIGFLFELDIYKYIDHKRTLHEFSFQGRVVSFISTDDAHKLRGRQHTFCWLNEVNDMEFEVFNQVMMRLEQWIYLDCNPSGHPWARTEIEEKRLPERGDVHLDVSVYTDNPFLPPAMVKEIENLRYVDEDLWSIYTLGVWTELKGLIYPKFVIVDHMPVGWKTYFGADFGWNDPTVLVQVSIKGKDMYVDCLVHQSELTLDEMAEKMKTIRGNPKILCDSAEPRTIEELRRRGVNARAAKKGPDSVRQRIMFIKQHNLHVTSSSIETIDEFRRYKWDEDKDGRIQDKPINMYKHSSDAISYAISRALQQTVTLI
jgi:phage terminase large subunit